MKATRIRGRLRIENAAPDEFVEVLRTVAAAINTTPHPLRDLRIWLHLNGTSKASVRWLWWSSAPLPAYTEPLRRMKNGYYRLSVPHRNQLGYALDEAAAWISEHGASEFYIYRDTFSGWWVVAIDAIA